MKYSVLDPRGIRETMKRIPLNPRLRDLDGKVVYCVCQDRPPFTEEVSKRLSKALPKAKVVFKRKTGWVKDEDADLMNELFQKADAVVYGTCMGCSSGMYAVYWMKEIERHGIPLVYMVGDTYMPDILNAAKVEGIPALRTVTVPTATSPEETPMDVITDKQYSEIIPKVIDALTVPLTEEEKNTKDMVTKKPPRIAMTGTLAEVQEYFYNEKLTDGLPIIPPTEEKVREMLKNTSHKPDEVITTTMWPNKLTATVEKVAIVGVMAGCRPEYMPVLLAITQVWGENQDFLHAAGSDSSMSLMTIVNGPIRKEIKMNGGMNATGPGNQANATIGRFLRLAMINLGGLILGVNAMSLQGSPIQYGFCFPENEEENPWEPFHVSHGYKSDESVVTIISGLYCHWSPLLLLGFNDMVKAMVTFPLNRVGMVLAAPGTARLYAAKGMSKEGFEKSIHKEAASQVAGEPPPKMPAMGFDINNWSVKVVVVGGGGSAPLVQAWGTNIPRSTSIDKWR